MLQRSLQDGGAVALAIERSVRATNSILRRFHKAAPDLLGIPFVLFMAVSAAPYLDKQPETVVRMEPRSQVYEAWIRGNIRNRMPRMPAFEEAVGNSAMREEMVMRSAMSLACAMFTAGEWHSTVGGCIDRLDLPGEGRVSLPPAEVGPFGTELQWEFAPRKEAMTTRLLVVASLSTLRPAW